MANGFLISINHLPQSLYPFARPSWHGFREDGDAGEDTRDGAAGQAGDRARRRYARWGPIFRTLAAAYAQLGRQNKATEALSRLMELEPSVTISHYPNRLPYQDTEQAERLWDGLRKAGLPE